MRIVRQNSKRDSEGSKFVAKKSGSGWIRNFVVVYNCYNIVTNYIGVGNMGYRHRGNVAGEHRTGDIGQLVVFLLFMALWLSDMFLEYSSFLNEYMPVVVRLVIGISLLIVSGYMAKTGLSLVFGKNAQSQGVIRKGVFGLVRHPIYLSEIILYLGLLILHISLAAVFIWIVAIFFLHYISRYEEKLLLEKYGKAYEQYMKEVPMWFPRIFRKQ